jgi:hypothetical protein
VKLEGLDAMRLQVVSVPDSMNGAVSDVDFTRHVTRRQWLNPGLGAFSVFATT